MMKKIVLFICLILFFYYLDFSRGISKGIKVDKIIVYKQKRKMQLLSQDEIIKTYNISLGSNPQGKKEFEGDCKTPEGKYYIDSKNPNSLYYKNIGISYPNRSDKENALMNGEKPGSDIKIHGMKNGWGLIGRFHLFYDWTKGCIAVTNREMDEIYDAVEVGTEIEIKE